MAYTNDQLSDMMDQLKARVNAIDGIGLVDPAQGSVPKLEAKYNGLKTDLKQSVLLLQGLLQKLTSTVNEYIALVKQHLGV